MDTLQRLVSLSIVLSFILFIGITVAILLGQRQPPSTWSMFLHLNQCELPCWVGITPGETTLPDGRKYIEQTYADTSLSILDSQQFSFRVTYKPTGYEFRVAFWTSDGFTENPQSIIHIIYLELYRSENKRATIPDLYSDLGNPESVQLITGVEKERVSMLYKEQQVLVFVDDLECDKVTLRQEITQITLVEESHIHNMAWLSEPQRWQGFGRCYNFVREIWP